MKENKLLTARKDDIGLPQSRLQAKAAKSSVYKWKVLKAVFAVQKEFGYLQQQSPMRLNPGKEKITQDFVKNNFPK